MTDSTPTGDPSASGDSTSTPSPPARPVRFPTARSPYFIAFAWIAITYLIAVLLSWNSVMYPDTGEPDVYPLIVFTFAGLIMYLIVASIATRKVLIVLGPLLTAFTVLALFAPGYIGLSGKGYTMVGCLYDETTNYDYALEAPTRVGWLTGGLINPSTTLYLDCNGRPVDPTNPADY